MTEEINFVRLILQESTFSLGRLVVWESISPLEAAFVQHMEELFSITAL